MRQTILSLALLALTTAASAQSTVTLNIKGVDDGKTITAELGATFQKEPTVAEATLSGGTCTMTLPCDEPRYYYFKVKDAQGVIGRLMTTKGEKPTVELTVKTTTNDQGTWLSDEKQEVFDSPMHAEYFIRVLSVREGLDLAYPAFHNAFKTKGMSRTNPEVGRIEGIFFGAVKDRYMKIATDNKDSFWGPFSLLSLLNYFAPEEKTVYDQFTPEVQNSFYGQIFKEQVAPKGLVGETYKSFDVIDAKGKATPSAKLMKGKKYVLIDFWASWCAPCRKEIPNLKNIYSQYSKKGLEIISLSIDKNDAAWKKALAEEKLPWPNGIDKHDVDDLYKVKAIPAIFLLDAQTGKIMADGLRGEALAKKIAELLK